MKQLKIEIILDIDNSQQYDWDLFHIGKDYKGNYYYRSGSGCSCNCIEESDWIRLTYANLSDCRRASKTYVTDEYKIRFENILKKISTGKSSREYIE